MRRHTAEVGQRCGAAAHRQWLGVGQWVRAVSGGAVTMAKICMVLEKLRQIRTDQLRKSGRLVLGIVYSALSPAKVEPI